MEVGSVWDVERVRLLWGMLMTSGIKIKDKKYNNMPGIWKKAKENRTGDSEIRVKQIIVKMVKQASLGSQMFLQRCH